MKNWLKLKMDDQQKSNLSIFIPKSKFGRAFLTLYFVALLLGGFHVFLSTFSGLDILFGVTDKITISDYNAFTKAPFLVIGVITLIGTIVCFYTVMFRVIRVLQNKKP
jgi:hypothetical protein